MSRRAVSSALVLLALAGAGRADDGAAPPEPGQMVDRSAEYRRLVRRYEALSPCQQHDCGAPLRHRFCAVLRELLRDDLTPGAGAEEVRRCLGEPAMDWGAHLLYPAEREGWFYDLRLRDGKLHKHVRVLFTDTNGLR